MAKSIDHEPSTPSSSNDALEGADRGEQLASVPGSSDNLPNQPDIQGLRNLLAIWDVEGPKAENGCQENQDHRAATASIYAKYLEQAAKEDKELVGRWTETVNILLTFAALFTAIVAAFLLAIQAENDPQPSHETNQILRQILNQFDNTTLISSEPFSTPSTNLSRILSWWHASLCCSISSAFGCLLSKQWIMHYDSQPLWANTTEKKAQLREVRYQSLSTWRFHAIIGSLPIILQASVLFFAIGLAEYLHPVKEHFAIVASFIGVVGAFYFVTLLAGTFVSTCPYKSPVTSLILRVSADITSRIFAVLCIAICKLGSVFVKVYYATSPETKECFLKLLTSMVNLMKTYLTISKAGEELDAELGERSVLGPGGMGAAGVLCWGMMHADPAEVRMEEKEHQAAAESIMSLPARIGIEASYRVGTFSIWCAHMFNVLGSKTPTRLQLLEADVMFHLVHHSTEASNLTQVQVADMVFDDTEEDNDSPFFIEAAVSNYICTAIRNGWSSRHGLTEMQVTGMRATTIAVYLRYQLTSWSVTVPEDRLYRDQVAQELPIILRSRCLDGAQYTAVVDAVFLLAIALVDDLVPGVRSIPLCSDMDPLELLLEALDRLSHYPIHHPPNDTMPLAVKSAFNVISETHRIKTIQKCPSVKQGRFSLTLLRLLRLARKWWHQESTRELNSPGAALVHELYQLLISLIDYNTQSGGGDPGILTFLASEGLTEVFEIYGHPAGPSALPSQPMDGNSPNNENATKALDYALGLCHRQPSQSRLLHLLSPHRSDQLSARANLSDVIDLVSYPHLIPQLIFNIEQTSPDSEHRHMLLTVCVKLRSAIRPLCSEKYAGLASDLDSIAAAMLRSGGFLIQPAKELLDGFEKWDELVAALKEVDGFKGTPIEKSGYPEISLEQLDGGLEY